MNRGKGQGAMDPGQGKGLCGSWPGQVPAEKGQVCKNRLRALYLQRQPSRNSREHCAGPGS